jgi:hypothetical protein
MREARIKFKEINELTQYLESLYSERDSTLTIIENINNKITNKEYDNNSDIFNPTTKDKLIEDQKSLKMSIDEVSKDIEDIKLELNILKSAKKEIKSKYRNQALSLKYKSNKTKYQNIAVGELSLSRKVLDIRYDINHDKDSLEIYVEFEDYSIYTALVGLGKECKITKKA